MNRRPKHLPAEQRREVTVAAVIELAAEQNPSEITTAAIAQRMGLTQGALFRHFPSKDAVLEAVMHWVAARLLARVERAAATAPDVPTALEAMFMAHIEFVTEHPGVPRVLFGELQRAGETPAKRMAMGLLQRYGSQLRTLMARGKESGQLAADLDEDSAVVLFIGTVQGLVMQSLLAGDVGRIRTQAPGVFAIYRRGLGVQP
ncbi:MAG: TetR/AcrR family transcriptional regulator [Thiohalomonadaceae bacterium]